MNFENKYFKGSVPVVFVRFEEDFRFEAPFAVVFLYNPRHQSKIAEKIPQLQEAECKILLCEKEEATEQLEDLCESGEIEIVHDSIQRFSGFIKTNSEFQGIGRIKEALECAVASFIHDLQELQSDPNEPKSKSQPEEEKEEKKKAKETHKLNEEDLEHELHDFDYFLTKIKENVTKASTSDDQTRKQNAENTILALAKYLSLEDSDEDS